MELTVDTARLLLTDPTGKQALHPGPITVSVGGSQPDARSVALMGRAPLTTTLD